MSSKFILQYSIEKKIFLIRGRRVMLDRDLAELYEVKTFNLNKAVIRNLDRFPDDFMFTLTRQEFKNLIFHFGISSWGGTRKLPRVFTEQGIAMLSSVLRSKRAVCVNIAIMRVFVKLREVLATHKELADRLAELERRMDKKDQEIMALFEAIRRLMKEGEEDETPKEPIGFYPRK
jgi:hypothetical protein